MSAQERHKDFPLLVHSNGHFSRAVCNVLNSPLTDSWQQLYQRHGWSPAEGAGETFGGLYSWEPYLGLQLDLTRHSS